MSASIYDSVNKVLIPFAGKIKDATFTGTTEQWESLPLSEREKYNIVNIIDDYGEVSEISINYVESLPVTGIENALYGLLSFSVTTTTVADGFLDSVSLFTKETTTGGYVYTADGIEASTDNVTYGVFKSLEYDGTDFTLTYIDDETEPLSIGDHFYYRTISDVEYYGGVELNQSLYPLGNKPVTLKQTLAAGSTTITFNSLPTTGDYMVTFGSSNGVNYKEIDTSVSGSVTLTYDAQPSAISVYCKIEKV